MKIKNKYIKKIITSGLIGSLLLNSVPFYSFANNEINTINTNEAGNIKEISPQMIAVLSSLAIGSGITITTNDDIYDIGRLFYDYVKNNNELTWDFVQSTFLASCFFVNDVVHVKSDFLNIVNDFFNTVFSEPIDLGSHSSFPYVGVFHTTNDHVAFRKASVARGIKVDFSECLERFSVGQYDFEYVRTVSYGNEYNVLLNGSIITTFTSNKTCYFVSYRRLYNDGSIGEPTMAYTYDVGVSGSTFNNCNWSSLVGGYDFPYSGGYDWDKVKDRENEGSVALPIPGNLDSLVGQDSDTFWDNTDGLINPCTQEIILPEVENPSISIGESIRLQTDANCSIYNVEDLVTKAEESKNQDDINNARNEVNKLPEGDLKEELQNRLDAIVPNISLTNNLATANLDVYIKSENSLVMTLDSNSITFDGFSSVEDMVKENTVTVTIKSSLPYELNSYLVQEITSLDDEPKILDKSILNIKANGTDAYNTFEDVGTTPILLLDNQNPGETNNHGIDFMLDADIPYENGNYKTVIKFEARQK